MDAVEDGQSNTVTHDGREIGELVPLRRRRRFVSRREFAAMSRTSWCSATWCWGVVSGTPHRRVAGLVDVVAIARPAGGAPS